MGSPLNNVYTTFQNAQKEREPFNSDLMNFRANENIEALIGNSVKALNVLPGFEFLESWTERPKPAHVLGSTYMKKGKPQKVTVPIASSRLREIHFKYRLTDDEESIIEEKKLMFPELLDGNHFLINGNRISPVAQLADAEFYKSGHGKDVTLKTFYMPVKISSDSIILQDLDGNLNYNTLRLYGNMFAKKIPIYLYLLAEYGFLGTLDYMGIKQYSTIVDLEEEGADEARDLDKYYYFKLVNKKLSLGIEREWLESNKMVNSVVIQSLLTVFSHTRISKENIFDDQFWLYKLGSNFSTNKQVSVDKAKAIQTSLTRLMDDNTKAMLRIPDKDKENIYAAIRFLIYNFRYIQRQDNQNLANKRARVNEYLLDSFSKKLTASVVRLVNRPKVTVDDLQSIFSNIKPNFLIKTLVNIPLVKYNNNTNTLDIFSIILKASKNGPQTQKSVTGASSGAKSGINISYPGKVDMVATSNNDPGTTIELVPFAKLYDPAGDGMLFFTEEPEIIQMTDDDLEKDIIDEEDLEIEID